MSQSGADSPALGLAGPGPHSQPWSSGRWLVLITLVCAVHIALLFMFGARKHSVPRAAADVPTLRLAESSDELLALNDPTLFALPHAGDFGTAMWSQAPVVKPPSFRWTEAPRWLPLSADGLMNVFNQFMRTSRVAGFTLQLKPPVRLSTPTQSITPALAQVSTMRVEGDLTERALLTPMDLPSWPYPDVIAPSQVQVLVDETGHVISAVVLPSDNSLEALSHYDAADKRALELARTARFARAPRLTLGQMIFTWHSVPPSATNAPAAAP